MIEPMRNGGMVTGAAPEGGVAAGEAQRSLLFVPALVLAAGAAISVGAFFAIQHNIHALIKGIERALPALALGAGLLASLLLSALLYSLAATRARAEQMASEMRFVATHDALTGLANRGWFHDQLKHALTRAARYRRSVAVLFVDLDRFKGVNDSLGHDAGDRMLRECAQRLKKCLRESDTVARVGGDEFVVLMEDYSSLRDTVTVAQKILANTAAPVLLAGREFTLSASVGISVYPEDGTNVETLLKNADIAMYRAKDRGRNNYQFYSTEHNRHFRSGIPVPPASEQGEVQT
jgi:diguanylate cyclase (GGDEF)-like protein